MLDSDWIDSDQPFVHQSGSAQHAKLAQTREYAALSQGNVLNLSDWKEVDIFDTESLFVIFPPSFEAPRFAEFSVHSGYRDCPFRNSMIMGVHRNGRFVVKGDDVDSGCSHSKVSERQS